MIYNVKVIDYLHGTQVRVYSHPMGVKADDYVDDYFNPFKEEKINEEKILNKELSDIGFKEESEKAKLVDDFTDSTKGVRDKERSLLSSKNRTINSIYDIARSNEWEYFLTLTFDPDKVDSFNYDEVTKKLSTWIDNFKRRYAPDLKYILVPELHKGGRYHFHGLLANIGNCSLIDSGHTDKSDNRIYNLGQYRLGFSTVTKINDVNRASSYIGKYITKELCATTFGKKRYWTSKNLDKPTVTDLCLGIEEIDDMLLSFNDRITYEKKVENYDFGFTTTYYELGE